MKIISSTFVDCIHEITGIDKSNFNHILDEQLDGEDWYQPFITELRLHSYDMIFFSYEPPIDLVDGVNLGNLVFNKLPRGKCIMTVTTTEDELKFICGEITDSQKFNTENIDANLSKINVIGFFIQMFI